MRPVRVLAFDPGNLMGWASLTWAPGTDIVTVLAYGTINGEKLWRKERKQWPEEIRKSFVVMDVYHKRLAEMFAEHNPDEVVSEGAFHHRFPAAFASLVINIFVIERVWLPLGRRPVRMVPPAVTKKAVAGDREAKKPAMRTAVLNHDKIVFVDPIPPETSTISEHEIDAIGHGAAFIWKELPTLHAMHPDRYI